MELFRSHFLLKGMNALCFDSQPLYTQEVGLGFTFICLISLK